MCPERKWLDGGDNSISSGGEVISLLWKLGCTLQINLNTSLTCLLFGSLVGNLPGQNFFLALGSPDVLNTDMDTLFQDTSIDKFVDTDSDSGFCNVEDNSSTSVVELVWHTLVDGWVGEDVDVVTNLYGHEVLGEVDGSMLPMFLGKHVTGTSPGSV